MRSGENVRMIGKILLENQFRLTKPGYRNDPSNTCKT
jgi:hypothetical protein